MKLKNSNNTSPSRNTYCVIKTMYMGQRDRGTLIFFSLASLKVLERLGHFLRGRKQSALGAGGQGQGTQKAGGTREGVVKSGIC